eukprot:jgi/Tetstr1/442018/TSEL_030199.t1
MVAETDARVMEQKAEAVSGSQTNMAAFLLDHANNTRLWNEVGTLHVTCMEWILFGHFDMASSMWTVAIPTTTRQTVMTPHELRE